MGDHLIDRSPTRMVKEKTFQPTAEADIFVADGSVVEIENPYSPFGNDVVFLGVETEWIQCEPKFSKDKCFEGVDEIENLIRRMRQKFLKQFCSQNGNWHQLLPQATPKAMV